jgi:hypothetical protein
MMILSFSQLFDCIILIMALCMSEMLNNHEFCYSICLDYFRFICLNSFIIIIIFIHNSFNATGAKKSNLS